METYRTVWLSLMVAAATVGAWTTLNAWSFNGALSTFVVVGVIGGCVTTALRGDLRWRAAVAAGAVIGYAALGFFGLALLLGMLVVPLLAIVAVSSPTAVVWIRRLVYWHKTLEVPPEPGAAVREGSWGPSITTSTALSEPDDVAGDLPVEELDDAAVCLAWRTSYLALQRLSSSASRLRLVQRRQHCLDELERRNPNGFAAWLASGARAAGDPSKYILRAERRDYPDRRV